VRFAGLAWSPDGSQLVFTAEDADRVSDLYTVRVDGTHLTRVTHDLGAISSVSWR
jgi:Tol biopolymer transport system component